MQNEEKKVDLSNINETEVFTEEPSTELMITNATASLNKESLELLEQIVAESDQDKTKDLTYLFNMNQNKKTMVRMDKLSGLQDDLVDQFVKRIAQRPDEISNKELLDGIKIVQDILERGQRQVGETDQPLIQINQQTNSVHIGESSTELNRESRERVKNAVLGLLSGLTTQQAPSTVEYGDKTAEEDQTDDI